MHISYAQRLEDYHLDLVFSDLAQGVYVDIGGGHPVADNVSFHFYLRGWRGLVVEPQRNLARGYASIRPRDRVVECLVGREDGVVDFHQVERLHGFSTMIEAHAAGAQAFGAGYRTEKRPVRRLSGLIEREGFSQIDFLKIDVEGAERAVLEGLDLARHRPRVICIEAVRPGDMAPSHAEWEDLLLGSGYQFAFWDDLNRFYVADEASELASRFPSAPAAWDSVKHLYEFGRVTDHPEHPDRLLADRLIRGFLARLPEFSPEFLRQLLESSAGPGGMERGPELRALLRGQAPSPSRRQNVVPDEPLPLDDAARAALGRIAASYDGGLILDD
jgi:FkbM family methyltransferase